MQQKTYELMISALETEAKASPGNVNSLEFRNIESALMKSTFAGQATQDILKIKSTYGPSAVAKSQQSAPTGKVYNPSPAEFGAHIPAKKKSAVTVDLSRPLEEKVVKQKPLPPSDDDLKALAKLNMYKTLSEKSEEEIQSHFGSLKSMNAFLEREGQDTFKKKDDAAAAILLYCNEKVESFGTEAPAEDQSQDTTEEE